MNSLTKLMPNMRNSLLVAMFVLLGCAVLFGGASRLHELRLALTELAALPLLMIATTALLRQNDVARHRFAFGIAACLAALPLVQLIPLHPAIWQDLQGRAELTMALEISGIQAGWLPLSLTPDKTWRSFLALIPPLAMFLGMLALAPASESRRLSQFILAAVLASILLGAAQLASGSGRLYAWPTTDPGNVVGLFANRNHLATLCLIGMPFAMVLGAGALRRGMHDARAKVWMSVFYLALSAVAIIAIRSRAGIVLFGPIFTASLLAAWVAAGRGRPRPLLIAMTGGAALAVAAVAAITAAPLLDRFDTSGAPEGRFENWPTVVEAADTYLPHGSGLGSFDAVYRSVEPLERLDATYFNQAHNDYLETWLETGWWGTALILAFLIWFGRRSWTAWRSGPSAARDLQRAASIGIVAVLLHSAVDYPLRTLTIATVFAFCCGLLELTIRSDAELVTERSGRRRSRR